MKNDVRDIFPVRLRELMAQKGVTQVELASSSGLAQSGISNYLRAVRLPGAEELALLSKALEIDVGYLLGTNEAGPAEQAYRSRTKGVDLEAIPKLHVMAGELSVEDLEELVAKNVAEMRTAQAENKATYLKVAALYLANLHDRLKSKTGDVPKRRSLKGAASTEEDSTEPVRIPPQVVSVAETLPNVHPGARDRVRDGALRAMRLARGGGSSGTGKAASTSGSTSSPSKGSPSDPHP